MPVAVQSLTTPISPPTLSSVPGTRQPGSAGFASLLSEAVARVDQNNRASQEGIDRLLSGESDEVHDVALAAQRNELQFELFLQVRNKMVQAYQEVMRMQL